MMGDPEYEFFVVDTGYKDHHFIVGEAKAVRILPRGLTEAFVRYLGRDKDATYTVLPTAMIRPKLWIDPFLEQVIGD
jgi:hypothetical protein